MKNHHHGHGGKHHHGAKHGGGKHGEKHNHMPPGHTPCDSNSIWNPTMKKCQNFMPECDAKTTVKKMNPHTHRFECVSTVECGKGTSKRGNVCVRDHVVKTPTNVSFFECADRHAAPAPACARFANASTCDPSICNLRSVVSTWKCALKPTVEQSQKNKDLCASHASAVECARAVTCEVVPEHSLPHMKYDAIASKTQTFGRCIGTHGNDAACVKAEDAMACLKLGTTACKFDKRQTQWTCAPKNPASASGETKSKCKRLDIDHNASACHQSGVCEVTPHGGFLSGEQWLR